ncbi:MAG: hypothetical protein JW699_07945 [Chitinispirillaceae bacterium]|nr:hypothetical protein [Chitinispirillaceae bacterium]
MDALALVAKILGIVLLAWTASSIFRHFTRRSIRSLLRPGSAKAGAPSAPADSGKKHSVIEHFLNRLLLYLWFIFLLAFSTGLIVNN